MDHVFNGASGKSRYGQLINRLQAIHGALNNALGDSNIEYLRDEELRDVHPVQWAATRVAQLIEELKTK